jgi:hypothetical protein
MERTHLHEVCQRQTIPQELRSDVILFRRYEAFLTGAAMESSGEVSGEGAGPPRDLTIHGDREVLPHGIDGGTNGGG